MTGYFITLEGGEGAGKSTVIQSLEDKLTQKGYHVLTTREPGGIEIAEEIREIILDPSHTMMDGYTEALLYAAARRQHLVEKVLPALKKDIIVLCDRFIDSSLAYQGYARNLGINNVLAINEFAIQSCMPHLTLLLNIEPEKGLKRITTNKHREQNRLDIEALSFHQRVHEGYLHLAEKYPERIQVISAEQQPEKVLEDSLTTILSFLQKKE